MKKIISLAIFALLSISSVIGQESYNYVFKNKTEGYACYRIPSIVRAANGDLLAFSEARKRDGDDFGDIDLVMKRSEDNGESWSKLAIVADNGDHKAGDAAPVVVYTGAARCKAKILILFNTAVSSEHDANNGKGIREVFCISSSDNGHTWSAPENITAQVNRPYAPDVNSQYTFKEDWRVYANAPGHAIQLKRGEHKGRVFVPGYHAEGDNKPNFTNYFSHGFYSDDFGKTWKYGATVEIPASNESIAAELSDGGILINCRYQNKNARSRILAFSSNGGESWDSTYVEKQLTEPICQGSMIDVIYKRKHYLLFSNPTSKQKREALGVRYSANDGKEWSSPLIIEKGNAAYSDLVLLPKKRVGVIYERGNMGGIVFKTVSLKDILNK